MDGPVIDLLKAERTALNLIQRLTGITTLTARFVEAVRPDRCVSAIPASPPSNLRMLEKFAVVIGGGYNHRFNLTNGVLIKDNHIAACGSISAAV